MINEIEDLQLSCSYCDEIVDTIDSLYKCENCNGLYCADHHNDYTNLCKNCDTEENFKDWDNRP